MLFCLIGPNALQHKNILRHSLEEGGGGKGNDALMPSIWVFCINLNKYYRKPFFCANDLLFFALISFNPGPGGG